MKQNVSTLGRLNQSAVQLSISVSRIKSIGVAVALLAAFALQPPSPAQAADLWSQHLHSRGTHISALASQPGSDPAYEPPPPANGRSYSAPMPVTNPNSSGGVGLEKLNLRTNVKDLCRRWTSIDHGDL